MVTSDSLNDSEIDDLTRQLSEVVESHQAWQLSECGSLYRIEGDLILQLVLFCSREENGLYLSLQYKMFPDDDLFWKIMEIEYEEQSKLRMRLSGAFRAPFLNLFDTVLEIEDWTLISIQQQAEPTLLDCENMATELIAEIENEKDHLRKIKKYIEEHFRKDPRSTNPSPYYMQVLTAIRNQQWATAENVIRQRLAMGNSSGVSTRKGTFFELAYCYLYSIGRTSPQEAPQLVESSWRRSRRRMPDFEAAEESVAETMIEMIDNFGDTDESVYWVEIYLIDTEPERHSKLAEVFGAWLGQYLIRHLGGDWRKTALGWGVSVVPGKLSYPIAQVEKYLKSGQAESLCKYVEEVRRLVEVH